MLAKRELVAVRGGVLLDGAGRRIPEPRLLPLHGATVDFFGQRTGNQGQLTFRPDPTAL
jgi:hypothetical protein